MDEHRWPDPDRSRSCRSERTDRVRCQQPNTAEIAVLKIIDPFDSLDISNHLYTLAKDPNIDGIVLLIHSYGGAFISFFLVHDMIKKVSTIKPVISYIVGGALSCGYLIVSASDYIIAHQGAEIGFIGSYLEVSRYKKPKITGNIKSELQVEVFTDCKLKEIFSPYASNLTDEQRAYVQKLTVSAGERFKKTIAQNRELNIENSHEWADGKYFQAPEALELNLIDKVGTFFDVEEIMLKLLKDRNPKGNDFLSFTIL